MATYQPPPMPERSAERIRAHYEVERELAARLRRAGRAEREVLYREVHDELYRRVPDHPELVAPADWVERAWVADRRLEVLRPFVAPRCTFVHVGAGDSALAEAVLRNGAARAYAVNVSEVITDGPPREGLELMVTDGRTIPVAAGGADLAFSNQLLERLHPDDALEQTANVCRALRPGGRYVCLTQARLTGPHDISSHYDDEATCLNLKEYSTAELRRLLGGAGFARVKALVKVRSRVLVLPIAPLDWIERALFALPGRRGRRLARRLPIRKVLGRVVAEKA